MTKNNKIITGIISLFLVATPIFALRALAVTDTTPPSQPNGLTATLNVGNQVILSWNPATDNTGVTGYTIMRNTDILANTVNTSYIDINVLASTGYSYSVLAYDAAGNVSSFSSSVSINTATSSDTTLPGTATNLVATASSSNQINLAWTAATDNIGVVGYTILRNNVIIANSAINSFTDMSVSPNTNYSYAVIAYDAAGNLSGQSNTATATTPAITSDTTLPSAPGDLLASTVSPSRINLSWSVASDNVGVTGYNIYRDNALIATSSVNSFANIGLSASTSYTFYVKSYDAAGNISAQSNVASATTLAVPSHHEDDDEDGDDEDEDVNCHYDNGRHLGQLKEHDNNGKHLGELKIRLNTHVERGNDHKNK
ncbi:MAG: fibronectin type III domain-containing protein [Patescibacteria group bacterium]|jgi:chitodextrinase